MAKRGLVALFFSLLLLSCFFTLQAFADSQVRIVRLSVVDGAVQIDRAVGGGFERAMVNLPITQGAKVRAQEDGRAEIEFEDGSAVRIASGGTLDFPLLSLRDSGARATTLHLQDGVTYVKFAGKKDDEFVVTFANETVHLTQPAHFRVTLRNGAAVLAVMKGSVAVEGPSGTVDVTKKQSATFDLADSEHFKVSKNIEQLQFDDWDKKQDQYHDAYLARNSSNSLSPYSYGMSDLNYYGNFFNMPGYGMVWQPYFVDASWDPFMSGGWSWYPGAGYMWVSSYPWGWMPYRYGSWSFINGAGWFWAPGNTWNTWGSMPLVVNAPQRFILPRPPAGTAPVRNTLMVNRGVAMPAGVNQSGNLVVRTNSAGLGIPRGSIRNPAQISHEVAQHGPVTMVPQRPSNSASGPAFGGAPSRSASAPSSQGPSSSPGMGPRSSGPSPGAMGGGARGSGPSGPGVHR